MYLRKMGSVSLLTREGEVEIAKRIEQGEHGVFNAILDSPVAVREIIDFGEKLRKHKIRVKEHHPRRRRRGREFDEEEADRRILRLIDKVKHLDKVVAGSRRGAQDAEPALEEGGRGRDEANRRKMVRRSRRCASTRRRIDKIVLKFAA